MNFFHQSPKTRGNTKIEIDGEHLAHFKVGYAPFLKVQLGQHEKRLSEKMQMSNLSMNVPTILHSVFLYSVMTSRLGIQIRNMKMVLNFYCTWRWVTFEKLMIKMYDFF